MTITLNKDANRSLSAPVSYTFIYIGNGGAFPGNKYGNISPFSFPSSQGLIGAFSVTRLLALSPNKEEVS